MLTSAFVRASTHVSWQTLLQLCQTIPMVLRVESEPASSQARLLTSEGCLCLTCMTTMLPTAAAACAALGEGGSPWGFMRSHFPLLTSMMCTSLVAPASRIPAQIHRANEIERLQSGCSWVSAARMCAQQRGQGIIWGFVGMRAKPEKGCGESNQSSRVAQAMLEDCPHVAILPGPLLHLRRPQRDLA